MVSHGGFRINVLNPSGRDPAQDFSGSAETGGHAPVNFHAYAACTGGRFLRTVQSAVTERKPVLLLLRGDFRSSERALLTLKKARVPVAISLKETGLHQIARQLREHGKLRRFLRIAEAADGCIAPTLEAADFYRTLGGNNARVAFIPTPYPLHEPRWDLSRPLGDRRGLIVGTREFDVPSRNHLVALMAARQISAATGEPVTVYNCDGRREERLLASLGFDSGQLEVRTRRDGYVEYLRVVAAHKIVFQLDTSFVPGQVAGDALLCRLLSVGGNGAIDRIAFPELCGPGRSNGELVEIAIGLMKDPKSYADAVAQSQQRASEHLSFAQGERELEEFFRRVGS